MDGVVDRIIRYASDHWHIVIPEREELREPEASSPYVDAYAVEWKDYSQKI